MSNNWIVKVVIGLLAGLFGTCTSDDCRMKSDRRQKVLSMIDKYNVRGKSKMENSFLIIFLCFILKHSFYQLTSG
jgi:hypothetical protein